MRCLQTIALSLLIGLSVAAQPAGDTVPPPANNLSIDLQFMGRGESRYGGMPAEASSDAEEEITEVGKSNFLLSRTRLAINFKRDWLEARVTPQHTGVWGQEGKGSFNLYESWVKLAARNGLFAQVGRVALNYDDERIIGSDNWAMASLSHDVLRAGYEGHGHKVHAILAYNQNAAVMTAAFSQYTNGSQPYKTMHTLWYHYDFPKLPLGASALFMNIGMQADPDVGTGTLFQQLAGAYVKFTPKRWLAEVSYYHQFGHNEYNIKIDAWMVSTKVSFRPANYGITVGYDHLSGDKNFAVPPKGGLGYMRHEVIRGFSTVYGAHHKFYGAMDFFYVSTYMGGFTPGLQNNYIDLSYSPLKGLDLSASCHYLATATKLEDLDRTLGYEFELQGSYAISRDVKVSLGASLMKGTNTMEQLKRSSNNNSLRWGWVSLLVNPRILSIKW